VIRPRPPYPGDPRFRNPAARPRQAAGETYEEALYRETFKDHYNPDETPDHGDLWEAFQSPVLDCRGIGAFQSVWDRALREHSRGQLLISAQTTPPSIADPPENMVIGTRIVGILGGQEDVIAEFQLSSGSGPARWGWHVDQIYERISVYAAQFADGQPSGGTLNNTMNLSISGRVWRWM
jgi:hypothetical protein